MSLLSAESVPARRSESISPAISPLRSVLKSIGSLWITVAVLLLLIVILLWGTVVANKYGDTAAKFGIYGAWWFNALGVILAVNSAASLALCWPWKRQQLGFTLPHLGLVVLLVGCYISRRYGTDATVSVIEGQSSNRVYQGVRQHVELDGAQHFKLRVEPADSTDSKTPPIEVPFTSGPFNWEDYDNGVLSTVPWSLAHRDRGILYDRDGIRLEVLDYQSNSEVVNLPRLNIEAASAGGEPKAFTLNVKADDESAFTQRRFGEGNEEQTPSGARVLFWMTGNEDETAAFRQSAPSGPLGKLGRVVLMAKGEVFDWPLDDWQPGSRRALGKSGLEVEFVDVTPDQGDVLVRLVIHKGESVERMLFSSEFPEKINWQDYGDGVFGTYWLARPDKTEQSKPPLKSEADSTAAKDDKSSKAKPQSAKASDDWLAKLPRVPPRVDFFQGADHKLYLRTWRLGEVKVVGPLRMGEDGGRITVFAKTPEAMELKFSDFRPADRPGVDAMPLPFDKEQGYRLRQAKVCLTVDGQADTFWIPCTSYDPEELRVLRYSPEEIQQALKKNIVPRRFLHAAAGHGRRVVLGFEPQSFELGFAVHLNKAWQKLDPGSPTQATKSFYASEIDLVPKLSEAELSAAAAGGARKSSKICSSRSTPRWTLPIRARESHSACFRHRCLKRTSRNSSASNWASRSTCLGFRSTTIPAAA